MTQSKQISNHSIGERNLWQSLCMIPVVRYLLQKKLDSLESSNEVTDEQDANTSEQVSSEEVAAYWQTYQHWQQADLNPKQQEWMQEIHAHLNSLQQSLFKSALSNSCIICVRNIHNR